MNLEDKGQGTVIWVWFGGISRIFMAVPAKAGRQAAGVSAERSGEREKLRRESTIQLLVYTCTHTLLQRARDGSGRVGAR